MSQCFYLEKFEFNAYAYAFCHSPSRQNLEAVILCGTRFRKSQFKRLTSWSSCSLFWTTFLSFFANRCNNQSCACWSKRPAVCSGNRAHFVFKSFSDVSCHCCGPRTCCSDNVHQSRENVHRYPCPQESSTRRHPVKSTASYDPKTREESSSPHHDSDRDYSDLPGSSTAAKSVSVIAY